ncbi:MAG: 16S rRNA processing protein RimM [bacterium]|nr:16S rRNA processing protein RimM [bacterium]
MVLRPHGLRGEVRIEIHSDLPERFAPGSELRLTMRGGVTRTVRVASFREVRGGGLIRFSGWRTRESAVELRGARLEVLRSDVPAAPEGLYYHFDLVGCRCFDAELGELGEVEAVVEDGGGVLLEVRGPDRVLPVPFVEAFLDEVDINGREIRLRLPEGLIETCASKS